jgi:hypothetical protein
LSVRWGSEVGVVGSGAVLGVQDDGVVALATGVVVVGLEVTGGLVEAEGVEEVVVDVGGVEELGDRGVGVLLRVGLGEGEGVLELRAWGVRAVVVEVVVVAIVVGLGDTVVSAGDGVGGLSITLPCELGPVLVSWVGLDSAVTLAWVVGSPWAGNC